MHDLVTHGVGECARPQCGELTDDSRGPHCGRPLGLLSIGSEWVREQTGPRDMVPLLRCERRGLAVGMWAGGSGRQAHLKYEFVLANGDGADEHRIKLLVMLGVLGTPDVDDLPFKICDAAPCAACCAAARAGHAVPAASRSSGVSRRTTNTRSVGLC